MNQEEKQMSITYALQAEARERAGKGAARALRRENKVPGVIYGDGKEPVTITLPAKEVNIEYNKGHMYSTLCDLKVGGEKHMVLARDVQLHPVTDFVQHVDFLRVTKKTRLAVMVPVSFLNEEQAPFFDKKGVMNVVRHEVELLCSAVNIPEALEVDLSSFDIGDTVKISAANMPEGSSPADGRDVTLVTIQEPRRAAEPETTEEAAAAEGEEAAAAEGEAAEGEAEKTEGEAA